MTNDERTDLERFNELPAAVWFDIARNGFRKNAAVRFHQRRVAMELGRMKLAGEMPSASQLSQGFSALKLIENVSRRPEELPAAFERPKASMQLAHRRAIAAAVRAIKGRPRGR
jgi:hypothetical protein